MLLKLFNTGLLQVNTYLLIDEDTKEAVVIDLGGDFDAIDKAVKESGAELKYVLNTHGHFDHIMGDVEIQKQNLDIPVYMHKNDLPLAKNVEQVVKAWGFAQSFPEVQIDKFIDESSDLKIGNHSIKVIETPGHTQGGVSFLIDNMLFSGDTLFLESIGRTDLDGGDYNTLVSSIKNKLFKLGDDIVVYPGHGPSTTIGHEKKYNDFLH